MVRRKEGSHDEENARCAASDLLADGCIGRKCSGTDGKYVDDARCDGTDFPCDEHTGRSGMGKLSLVLRVEVLPHLLSVRGELLVRM